MTSPYLFSAAQLHNQIQANPSLCVIDCRSMLSDTSWGESQYKIAHIPGAYFAHLERDLSGPIIKGRTGRHPLPDPSVLARFFGQLGITPETHVVAYDQDSGAYACRLWWLLRWLGHEKVSVLDGGWRAWIENGFETVTTIPTFKSALFIAQLHHLKCVNADDVLHGNARLIDARGADRFAGRNETIDPVAGHIPGALNFPFLDNLNSTMRFKSVPELQQRFMPIAQQNVISYCGSGVTACHNIFAMCYAGYPEPQLYAGSWSEWICNPSHPIHIDQ